MCSARGPATGVPTKTEQGDLWQVLGAGQGDYPRIIVAPSNQLDLFKTIPELFNLCDKYQCPGLVLSDLLISEGTSSIDPAELDFNVKIDRGELILPNGNGNGETRIRSAAATTTMLICVTRTPRAAFRRARCRACPGTYSLAATDEHDEDGTLISDEFTNPHKRRMMVEKRARKMETVLSKTSRRRNSSARRTPQVTLVGWGSTQGVIREAVEKLAGEEGIVANQLAHQMDRSVPCGRRSAASSRRSKTGHHRREQLQRPVRPLSAVAKPASTPTATSASTTANRSCRTTSSKRSKNNWPARAQPFRSGSTKSYV